MPCLIAIMGVSSLSFAPDYRLPPWCYQVRFVQQAGLNVDLLFDGNEVLDIRLPSHVVLEVTETEPGFKGNTATGATKPATVETGYTLNVPLFINEEDKLRIDTRTGDYVERSKE